MVHTITIHMNYCMFITQRGFKEVETTAFTGWPTHHNKLSPYTECTSHSYSTLYVYTVHNGLEGKNQQRGMPERERERERGTRCRHLTIKPD